MATVAGLSIAQTWGSTRAASVGLSGMGGRPVSPPGYGNQSDIADQPRSDCRWSVPLYAKPHVSWPGAGDAGCRDLGWHMADVSRPRCPLCDHELGPYPFRRDP